MPRPKRTASPTESPAAVAPADSGTALAVPEAAVAVPQSKATPQDVLKANYMWEGWAKYNDKKIQLGPDSFLELPERDNPDPDVVGFAMPLACIEYALRNERKFPPPGDEDMFREMFKLIHHTLKTRMLRRSYTMSIIYNHINRNYRDSPGWQRGFIRARGPQFFFEIWIDPDPPQGKKVLGDKYWILAIFGRMIGTCEESRRKLLSLEPQEPAKKGVVDIIIEGTQDPEENIRDCALCSLKALIQSVEGRAAVPYQKLIQCLQKKPTR